MGWLDLGKPNKDINVDALFREAEQKERLLRELETANQESSGGKSGITLDNKGDT